MWNKFVGLFAALLLVAACETTPDQSSDTSGGGDTTASSTGGGEMTPEVVPEPMPAAPAPTPSTVTSARDEPLSMTVSDSIRRQVEEKWNVPAGARDAGELDVEIYISLLPDGTVRKAEIVDRARMAQPGGEYYRSMAESARRAVLQASPLHDLPPDRYEEWREITFRFRPPV